MAWDAGSDHPQKNVLGGSLATCSKAPVTGWFRDGCCATDASDHGLHGVCVVLTTEFLAFSKARGNDLSTPRPELQFPGLLPGNRWCLCAARWQEAFEADAPPLVVLAATNEAALAVCRLEDLLAHAIDAA